MIIDIHKIKQLNRYIHRKFKIFLKFYNFEEQYLFEKLKLLKVFFVKNTIHLSIYYLSIYYLFVFKTDKT
jgi:hypothetical protein